MANPRKSCGSEKGGWKDWSLKTVILEGDWTFVTKNSIDFRGPASRGQYAGVAECVVRRQDGVRDQGAALPRLRRLVDRHGQRKQPQGRHRWLARNEAARLLGAALGYIWDKGSGTWRRRVDGRLERRERWIIDRRRRAARFTLIGLYSARREETIRRTQWLPTLTHPWMNLNAMIYQGRGAAEARTKKRRPRAKIANRLRPRLVRWRLLDAARTLELRAAGIMGASEEIRFVVHRMHDGQPLAGKNRSAWQGILEDAGLDEDVVRHTLRHTAATWSMQGRGPICGRRPAGSA
jgi:hypothetical protein